MQISFYVLNDTKNNHSKVSATDALLHFVCKLTQTVLEKSEQTLIILDDNLDRLAQLDKQLWDLSATSFLPHDLMINKKNTDSIAPVILTDKLPKGFDGVVLNLASKPLNVSATNPSIPDTPNAKDLNGNFNNDEPVHKPSRLLEIIPSDIEEKEKGRLKYKHYQALGLTLDYFPITN